MGERSATSVRGRGSSARTMGAADLLASAAAKPHRVARSGIGLSAGPPAAFCGAGRCERMSAEPDHLAQLRSAAERMRTDAGADSVREAVALLLQIAIAHHEATGLGVSEEQVPDFMEAGGPVAVPPAL